MFHKCTNARLEDMAPPLKDLGLLNPSRTAFFMCDMQEKFRPAMLHFDEVVSVARKMVRKILFPLNMYHLMKLGHES